MKTIGTGIIRKVLTDKFEWTAAERRHYSGSMSRTEALRAAVNRCAPADEDDVIILSDRLEGGTYHVRFTSAGVYYESFYELPEDGGSDVISA